MVRLQRPNELLGHGPMHPAMKIDGDRKISAYRLADGSHSFNGSFHLRVIIDIVQFFRGVHLNAGEALALPLLGVFDDLAGPVAAYPRIGSDLLAYTAAEKFMDWQAIV